VSGAGIRAQGFNLLVVAVGQALGCRVKGLGFRGAGVQGFRGSGVQGFRGAGVQGFSDEGLGFRDLLLPQCRRRPCLVQG